MPATFGYRLPTEAEWEYACRAGTTTQFSCGDDPERLEIYAWFRKNAPTAQPVGQKVANALGRFDMHGNAWEWCQDFYAADYYSKSPPNNPTGPAAGSVRVTRGGYYDPYPVHCRSAFRRGDGPDYRNNRFPGFRVVRGIDGSTSLAPAATTPEAALATTTAEPTKSLAATPISLADLSRGLVGHWNEEGQGAVAGDSSGNENDGKLQGLDAAKAWQSDAPPSPPARSLLGLAAPTTCGRQTARVPLIANPLLASQIMRIGLPRSRNRCTMQAPHE